MIDKNKEDVVEVQGYKKPSGYEADVLEDDKAREEASIGADLTETTEEVKLLKMNASDFSTYNSMAERMEHVHNHFRQTWNILHTACIDNERPKNLSLGQFLSMGLRFCSHLAAHHDVEEQYVFPVLAAKMPEFKAGRNAAELLRQHKEIHKGMDVLEEYLNRCRSGETELRLPELKLKMDPWGEVLWKHLDQEVKTLGAENMRKYWTLEEMPSVMMHIESRIRSGGAS